MSFPTIHTNPQAWLLAALPSLVALLGQAGTPA